MNFFTQYQPERVLKMFLFQIKKLYNNTNLNTHTSVQLLTRYYL